ncbi:MAG: hypothetical protein CMD51_06685 [Gammaproteobacteria bacterium]|nr:hypothetical protein [Gammaproteobacteria bacterium]
MDALHHALNHGLNGRAQLALGKPAQGNDFATRSVNGLHELFGWPYRRVRRINVPPAVQQCAGGSRVATVSGFQRQRDVMLNNGFQSSLCVSTLGIEAQRLPIQVQRTAVVRKTKVAIGHSILGSIDECLNLAFFRSAERACWLSTGWFGEGLTATAE